MTDAPVPPPATPLDRPFTEEVSGFFASIARRLLGESPGVRALGTGLMWVAAGLVLQVVGFWLATLLPADVTLTRLFVMLSTVFTAVVGLVILCGVMTMLAGAIRYGVGATDR